MVSGMLTAYGPLLVATMVSKLLGWTVEVVDENNWHGRKNRFGLPDYAFLERQKHADVVGVFCGITCAIKRAWEIAVFFKNVGSLVVAGGRHAYFFPEETLRHGFDVVFHGEAELALPAFLQEHQKHGTACFASTPYISFMQDGVMCSNVPNPEDFDDSVNQLQLAEEEMDFLPAVDFGLVGDASISIFTVCCSRGCRWHCEFCSVSSAPRYAPNHAMRTIDGIVKTRGTKDINIFFVDDRFSEDNNPLVPGLKRARDRRLAFVKRIATRYGRSLRFIFQARLPDIEDEEFIDWMRRAGFEFVCRGDESPIDADLKAMKKGYASGRMVAHAQKWTEKGFRAHSMEIGAFPVLNNERVAMSAAEIIAAFKRFIRAADPDTIQVFLAGAVPGSQLRKKLIAANRLLAVPWEFYTGDYPMFVPSPGMTIEELQSINVKLMKWFYGPWRLLGPFLRILSLFSADRPKGGWKKIRNDLRTDWLRILGYFLVSQWLRRVKKMRIIEKIKEENILLLENK